MPADHLFFASLVPTLLVDRNWQGPVKRASGETGQAVAMGNSLAAALGFDRSGWGEAVVAGLRCARLNVLADEAVPLTLTPEALRQAPPSE